MAGWQLFTAIVTVATTMISVAAAAPRRIVMKQGTRVCALAVDEQNVYWMTSGLAIGKMPKSGLGRSTTLAKVKGPSTEECLLRLDATHVYASTPDGVYRVAKTGGVAQALLSEAEAGSPVSFALDGDDVYVVEPNGLGVLQIPKRGGAAVPLVTKDPGASQAAGPAGPIAVVDGHIYWVHAGRLFRVPVSGGAPQLVLDGAQGTLVAADRNTVYWAPSKPGAAVAKNLAMVEPLEVGAVANGVLAGIRGKEIWAYSLGHSQRLIDRCEIPKGGVATDGVSVFWSELPYSYDEANAPKIVRFDLTDAAGPAPPMREPEEAANALREWIGNLRRGDTSTFVLPVMVKLSCFGDEVKQNVATADDLARLSQTLREQKEMRLFDFEERCWDWKPVSDKARRALPFPPAALERALSDAVVIRSHQNYQCPFVEVTAALRRVSGRLVPTLIHLTSGYDCE